MTGELGTHIRDDTPMNTLVGVNQNRHHLAVTLYENTVYRIRIQLDCDRPSSKGSYDINCNLAQDVNVLIDHNNDGRFDESESHVPNRWPLLNSMGLGIYDLSVSIPSISDWNMKAGVHRVRVVVMPSEEQNRKCGPSNYREVREYTFNVIPRVATYAVEPIYEPPPSYGNAPTYAGKPLVLYLTMVLNSLTIDFSYSSFAIRSLCSGKFNLFQRLRCYNTSQNGWRAKHRDR